MTQINSNDSKDLILSALTLSWEICECPINAQDYVGEIINLVENKNFEVDKRWVYKIFLMLFGENLDLQPIYFMAATTPNVPQSVYANHELIYDSVKKAFDLIEDFHLSEKDLTDQLAVLPIVYYIFKQKHSKTTILPTNSMSNVYKDIKKYLCRSIVKNLYEEGADDILKNIRDIINTSSSNNHFPYNEIKSTYTKLIITNADVDNFLATRKQNAFPVLNIIYALGASSGLCMTPVAGQAYDVDHMHPKATFTPATLSTISFNTPNDANVANDGITYDTVANLELLDNDTNRSKNKKPLKDWLNNATPADQIKYPQDHFFKKLSIDIADFGTFVDARKQLLKQALCLI